MIRTNIRISASMVLSADRTGRICDEELQLLKKKTAKLLRIHTDDIKQIIVRRKAIDARNKGNICFNYIIDAVISEIIRSRSTFIRNLNQLNSKVTIINNEGKQYNPLIYKNNYNKTIIDKTPPVVVGAGPAGLFCTYVLALNGLNPILIEQGSSIEQRSKEIEDFWNNNTRPGKYSNVCFGEGGAGTFSDGKLNTLVKDSLGRIEYVKKIFVENGAPEEIMYLAKPHIGTDELRHVIINIRKKIAVLGGQVHFNTRFTNISIKESRVTGIDIENVRDGTKKYIDCTNLILATGHSARETYNLLKDKLRMESKDFAIGLRIQHVQNTIDENQYGKLAAKMPVADYKLTHKCSNGRSVYSFCMCPGGFVVNASTEPGYLAVNGMSNHSRSSGNANSAIVANVTSADFENDDVLAGVEFQRKWEEKAYKIGSGMIPLQTFKDYKNNIPSDTIGGITSVTKGGTQFANLREALPDYVNDALIEAIESFNDQIKGFGADDVLLCGVETRTSSPVRILRDDTLQSDVKGVYPCGEGAGYAGGIMSAAVDGLKCAKAVLES